MYWKLFANLSGQEISPQLRPLKDLKLAENMVKLAFVEISCTEEISNDSIF